MAPRSNFACQDAFSGAPIEGGEEASGQSELPLSTEILLHVHSKHAFFTTISVCADQVLGDQDS